MKNGSKSCLVEIDFKLLRLSNAYANKSSRGPAVASLTNAKTIGLVPDNPILPNTLPNPKSTFALITAI